MPVSMMYTCTPAPVPLRAAADASVSQTTSQPVGQDAARALPPHQSANRSVTQRVTPAKSLSQSINLSGGQTHRTRLPPDCHLRARQRSATRQAFAFRAAAHM
eukprot:6545367-Pyramimonas_sp.AAC.1